mmetsp:Transcript_26666/g.84742  ORF Transcript_26666/g.84742 Transcript_26666/m.84742 type:complete len:210 (+) Transcript_26666:1128-1757(+)
MCVEKFTCPDPDSGGRVARAAGSSPPSAGSIARCSRCSRCCSAPPSCSRRVAPLSSRRSRRRRRPTRATARGRRHTAAPARPRRRSRRRRPRHSASRSTRRRGATLSAMCPTSSTRTLRRTTAIASPFAARAVRTRAAFGASSRSPSGPGFCLEARAPDGSEGRASLRPRGLCPLSTSTALIETPSPLSSHFDALLGAVQLSLFKGRVI